MDVKHVPAACIVEDAKGQKFYQYTALDEFSRFRHVEAFSEAGTHTSTIFLKNMLKAFPFKVECVQTDNDFEFTKLFVIAPTDKMEKWERSYRKDNEYFF